MRQPDSDLACQLGSAGLAVLSWCVIACLSCWAYVSFIAYEIPTWLWWACAVVSPLLWVNLNNLYHWFWGHCQQYRHRKVDLP